MSDIDDRIAAALRAAANQVSGADLTPADPPTSVSSDRSRRPGRWIAPVIAAAAVVGIAVTVTAVANNHPSATGKIGPGGTTASTPPQTPESTQATSLSTETSSAPGDASYICLFADASPCSVPYGFIWYVPLWPFANYTQVKQWEVAGGSQPWHLDPGQTALNFTRGYLGFTDIDRVTSTSVANDQAKIGVGYLNPAGKPVTAAVLHLVRYEQQPNTSSAPWEVVGSEDTTLSLETPKYDSTTGPTFTAGGHITGVDESLHIWVRSLNGTGAFVDDCCFPAGGQNQPWSRQVDMSHLAAQPTGGVTIVVSTGGHVQQHERFAIQGVVVAP